MYVVEYECLKSSFYPQNIKRAFNKYFSPVNLSFRWSNPGMKLYIAHLDGNNIKHLGKMAFGKIPNPITKESLKNLDTARHFIEMLEMLEKKTAGNLADDEKKLLEEILHQLRMTFMDEQPS